MRDEVAEPPSHEVAARHHEKGGGEGRAAGDERAYACDAACDAA